MLVNLCKIPGSGISRMDIPVGTTLGYLAEQQYCASAQLILNGQLTTLDTVLQDGDEVFAYQPTKGSGGVGYTALRAVPRCEGCGGQKLKPDGLTCWYCDRQSGTTNRESAPVYVMGRDAPQRFARRIPTEAVWK